jgi:hypothetical protein
MEEASDVNARPEESYAVSTLVYILKAYRRSIVLIVAAAAILYATIAVVVYLLAPSVAITSQTFHLDFTGASRGEYPNGLKFTVADLLSIPILTKVYVANDLGRFMPFSVFVQSITVVSSNPAYQQLVREYDARFADPKISQAERSRLEQEFDDKRASLSKSDYTIVFVSSAGTQRLPQSLASKVVSDILPVWARTAEREYNVVRYRVAVASPHLFDQPPPAGGNLLIAAHVLRSKLLRVAENLDDLVKVPGAEVARAAGSDLTLYDLRTRLDEITRFELDPLIGIIIHSGLKGDTRVAAEFLRAQLEFDLRQLADSEARVNVTQQALDAYSDVRPSDSLATGANKTSSVPNEAVMPQVTEGFIDRVVQLAGHGADRAYRQKLADEIKAAATIGLPARSAVEYDRNTLKELETSGGSTIVGAEQVRADLNRVNDELRVVVQQLNTLYSTLSWTLDATHQLYSITSPTTIRVHRGVSPIRLALWGIAVMLAALPLALAISFLSYRLKVEEQMAATQ